MKKLLLTSILFMLLLSVSPKSVFAQAAGPDCYAPGRGGCAGGVACAAGVCCRTQDLCTSFLSSHPNANTTSQQFQNLQNTTNASNQQLQGNSPILCSGTGINTAIGCIPFGDTNALMGFILKWAIGVGGGIAFILILVAGFQIMTSTGNPERLKAGQELLTSAIAGLIMLIFSVFILRVIGIDILKIPGLGG